MKTIRFELPVYPFHTDFIGHVNNVVYIQWMEIGRMKLMEDAGIPIQEAFKQGFVPVLIHTDITYKSPLYLGDTVQVELWLSELRNASAVMQFRFYNDAGTLVAEGTQRGLFADHRTLRPRRLRPEERSLFLPYVRSQNID